MSKPPLTQGRKLSVNSHSKPLQVSSTLNLPKKFDGGDTFAAKSSSIARTVININKEQEDFIIIENEL